MIFKNINRINRRHRRKGAKIFQHKENITLKRQSRIRSEEVELKDSIDAYIPGSYEGKQQPKEDYSIADEKILENLDSPGEFDESEADSKYGLSVFDISETELGESLDDSSLELSPEDSLCGMLLEEHLEAPYHSSREDVLDKLGMHIEYSEDRRKRI